ncbi:SPOR domain-containing protein [Ferrimonas marina]|uniref:SPOR domain-containing protein n=1 Tax=Ferrimonas marina TaxID=299255 RepID=UPI000B1CF306|nr:SPOR domain-containing protein [Ferrimonas marina]
MLTALVSFSVGTVFGGALVVVATDYALFQPVTTAEVVIETIDQTKVLGSTVAIEEQKKLQVALPVLQSGYDYHDRLQGHSIDLASSQVESSASLSLACASLRSESEAREQVTMLIDAGVPEARVVETGEWYQIRVGRDLTFREADRLSHGMDRHGYHRCIKVGG